MARPTTKDDLVAAASTQFEALWTLVDSMSDEDQRAAFLFDDRDRNLRDVLVHLRQWHMMVLQWHDEGTIHGGTPAVPGVGYTWRTLPDLNLAIWEKYQDTDLAQAKAMLKASHAEVMDVIASHTNDELFAKGVYPWTKSSTLGAYFVSSTSSHYDWAMKKIKKQISMAAKQDQR